MTFELPSGLPEVIHELRRLITDPNISVALSPVLFEATKLLASISGMVEEIGKLENEKIALKEELDAEYDVIVEANCQLANENESRRALNAEMRTVLSNVKIADVGNRSFIGVQAGPYSCASAEINSNDREIFAEWRADRDAILAKSEAKATEGKP
jgi:hypothetical protein